MTRASLRARLRRLEDRRPEGAALEVWAEVEDAPHLLRQTFPPTGQEMTRQEVRGRKAGRLVIVEYGEGGRL